MRILLTGASGLIGQALIPRLLQDGHSVVALCRHPRPSGEPKLTWLAADMMQLTTATAWRDKLVDIDAVVNAVGIFRDSRIQSFDVLHEQAPAALFAACAEAGVKRVVQISALGASTDAATHYWRSKGRGDAALIQQDLNWVIVRPSLVFAADGISSRFFLSLAAQTPLWLPGGAGSVQPIHLDDLTDLLAQLLSKPSINRQIISAVGPRELTFADYLRTLRAGLHMQPTMAVTVPSTLMSLASRLSVFNRNGLLTPASLLMMRSNNTADSAQLAALLGRPLRDPANFARPEQRAEIIVANWLPLARLSLAAVWFCTVWASYAHMAESVELLRETPLPKSLYLPALFAGIALDGVFGLLTLLQPSRKLWLAQLALIIAYTLIITFTAPHWWLHPFGPLSKNLPILALLYLLMQLERN